MATLQSKIKNRFKSLEELDGVSVDITDGFGQILVSHKKHHVADFQFKWVDESHYVGYFIDAHDNKSQAIVSLWSAMDAIKFMVLYSTLIDLRAMR